MSGSRLVLAALVTSAAACGTGASANVEVVTHDSAGVTIVESSATLEMGALAWVIAEQPDLRIGVAEGDDPYQLFQVSGAVQTEDGSIVVANAGTQEIRYFNRDGQHVHSSGRRGSGPGEFQMPQLLPPLGARGELLIWDMMANRFTLLDGSGSVSRMVTPTAAVRTPRGWDGVGAVLNGRTTATAGLDTPEGVMSNDFVYEIVKLDGGEPLEIAVMQARVYHARIRGQPWFRRIPFDPQPSGVAGPAGFYVTAGSTPQIEVYDGNAQLSRVLRVDREPEALRRADFDRLVELELDGMRDSELRTEWRRRYAQMPVPPRVPVYRALLVDEVGHVWAEHFRVNAAEAATWTVFDAEGGALGTMQTPVGVNILHIGERFLWGLVRTDLGVEQVVRYSIDRMD